MPTIIKFGGGSGSSQNILNFPISIQVAEPTPQGSGHIWVKSDNINLFNNIVIDDSIRLIYTNGYLMLIVPDVENGCFNIAENKNVNNKDISLKLNKSTNTNAPWAMSKQSDGVGYDFKLLIPIVYSRINDVLKLETAYHYNGVTWEQICQDGKFIYGGSQNTQDVFAVPNDNNLVNITNSLNTIFQNGAWKVANVTIAKTGQFFGMTVVGRGPCFAERDGLNFRQYTFDVTTKPSDIVLTDYTGPVGISNDNKYLIATLPINYSGYGLNFIIVFTVDKVNKKLVWSKAVPKSSVYGDPRSSINRVNQIEFTDDNEAVIFFCAENSTSTALKSIVPLSICDDSFQPYCAGVNTTDFYRVYKHYSPWAYACVFPSKIKGETVIAFMCSPDNETNSTYKDNALCVIRFTKSAFSTPEVKRILLEAGEVNNLINTTVSIGDGLVLGDSITTNEKFAYDTKTNPVTSIPCNIAFGGNTPKTYDPYSNLLYANNKRYSIKKAANLITFTEVPVTYPNFTNSFYTIKVH